MKKPYTDNYVFIRIHMERFHVANSQSSRGVEVIQQLQPFGNGQASCGAKIWLGGWGSGSPSFATDLRQSNRFAVLLLLLLRSLVAIPKRPLKQKLAQSWIMSRLGFVLKCKICPWDKAWNLIGPGELEEWNLIVPWCSMQFYAILHCSWFMLIHVDWNISQSFPPAEAVSSIRGSVLEPREIACSCWKMLNAFGQQLINHVQHLSTTVGRNLLLCATHESLELNCPVISPDSLIVAESPVLSVMRFCDLTCSLPETRWSDHSFHCRGMSSKETWPPHER